MDHQLINQVVEQVLAALGNHVTPLTESSSLDIPIGVSARHVHLSQQHVEQLFGPGYQLTEKSPLSQPGQFAANEQVTIVGPKNAIHSVRILGPARDLSQVEISATDMRTLGVDAPLRLSGNIEGSAPITLIGPKGSLYLKEGCIIAASHIHMSPKDAQRFSVEDGQDVFVEVQSKRPIIFSNVKIRVNERFALEMHIDTDEGNAGLIKTGAIGRIINMSNVQSSQVNEAVQQKAPKLQENNKQQSYSKKLLTEKDVLDCQGQELLLSKKTIVTALAHDKARQLGIKIIRQ